MKEIRIEARIKNNILWHLIYDKYGTTKRFSEAAGLSAFVVGNYLNLKVDPIRRGTGTWKKTALDISNFLKMLPEDIFPPSLYNREITKVIKEVSIVDLPASLKRPLLASPEEMAFDNIMKEEINDVIHYLHPRQQEVIRMRYWDRMTLETCAIKLGLTKERIRQIQFKALRKLRSAIKNRRGGLLRQEWDEAAVLYRGRRGEAGCSNARVRT